MHSVLQHECTGCGLCVEPCPVDCIDMVTLSAPDYVKDVAREHFNAKQIRLLRDEQDKQQAYREKRQLVAKTADELQDKQAKQAYILQALQRVNMKPEKNS